jgi:hypothetical protein
VGFTFFREKESQENKYTGFVMCFERKKKKKKKKKKENNNNNNNNNNFTLFGRLKKKIQSVSNILEWVFRNLKTLKRCCSNRIKRKMHNGDVA